MRWPVLTEHLLDISEMLRKLLMTSVLVFLYPGTPSQLAFALVFSLIFLVWFMSSRPYLGALPRPSHGPKPARAAIGVGLLMLLLFESQSDSLYRCEHVCRPRTRPSSDHNSGRAALYPAL